MSEVNEKVSIAWNPIICYPRFTAWLHVLTDNTVPPHASIVFYSSNCMCQPDKTNALFFPRAFPLTRVIRGIFFNLTHYQLHHEFSRLVYSNIVRLCVHIYVPLQTQVRDFLPIAHVPTLTPNSTYILTSFSKVVNSTRRVFIAVCVSHSRCTLFPINDRNFEHWYKVSRYIVSFKYSRIFKTRARWWLRRARLVYR